MQKSPAFIPISVQKIHSLHMNTKARLESYQINWAYIIWIGIFCACDALKNGFLLSHLYDFFAHSFPFPFLSLSLFSIPGE